MLKEFGDKREFPRPFWVLMAASLIDHIGAFMLLPFFALYITQRFGIGMTQMGQIFLVFALAGTAGGILGGAIADKFGRRRIILFGIVASALISLLMGFANSVVYFFLLAPIVGLLQDIGGPAQSALVADVLPRHRHVEGFSIWRVTVNVSAVIGPILGGFLADYNFLYLFLGDAILSIITAIIVYFILPETKPQPKEGEAEQSMLQTFSGYRHVLRDKLYVSFLLISMLGVLIYSQVATSMPVYLRDIQGIPPRGYGYLISLNAVMVVGMQFWITRRLKGYAPLLLVALGTLFYAVGFGMYGFGGGLLYYAVGMAVLTIGEMIIAPTGQALAARFAPEDMRGRYMALFGFSWALPFAFGPLMAGYVMDNYNPNWVWYACGVLGGVCILGYLILHARAGSRLGLMGEDSPVIAAPAGAPTSPSL